MTVNNNLPRAPAHVIGFDGDRLRLKSDNKEAGPINLNVYSTRSLKDKVKTLAGRESNYLMLDDHVFVKYSDIKRADVTLNGVESIDLKKEFKEFKEWNAACQKKWNSNVMKNLFKSN